MQKIFDLLVLFLKDMKYIIVSWSIIYRQDISHPLIECDLEK